MAPRTRRFTPANKREFLRKIYENLKEPSGYSGENGLYERVKELGRKDISRRDIKEFLEGQPGWNFHGLIPRKFVRKPTKVCRQGLILGIDLLDLTQKIAKHNKKHRYIFLKIDLFSRKLWLTPLTNKSNLTCARALESFLEKSLYKYSFVFSDQGCEFVGKHTQKVYDKFNIRRYSVKNQKYKCAIAERAIRTIKQRLFRYFSQQNTLKYIDVLAQIEEAYNKSPHRGLGYRTPNEIHLLKDVDEIKEQERIQLLQKLKNYGAITKRQLRNKISSTQALAEGTHVRLLLGKAEGVFQKSYQPIFTKEIFVIHRVVRKFPFTYYLRDLLDHPIEGLVYREELKPVTLPEKFAIDRVLKREVLPSGATRYLVSWDGYPQHFNSYVNEIETP